VYHPFKWFMVWRSVRNLSNVTIMADNVLEVPKEDASDSDDLEECRYFY